MANQITQNTATEALVFLMVLSADHITGATGKTCTVTISKNGGAFATPAGAISEIGNGFYKIAPNTSDSNTLGSLIVHATATACDPTDKEFEVITPAVTTITGAGSLQTGSLSLTTSDDIYTILSEAGATSYADHNNDGDTFNSDESQAVNRVIYRASALFTAYLGRIYSNTVLASNNWVITNCAVVACYYLTRQRGNAGLFKEQYDEIIELLGKFSKFQLQLPDAATAAIMLPSYSNLLIDQTYEKSKIRVDRWTSNDGTAAPATDYDYDSMY